MMRQPKRLLPQSRLPRITHLIRTRSVRLTLGLLGGMGAMCGAQASTTNTVVPDAIVQMVSCVPVPFVVYCPDDQVTSYNFGQLQAGGGQGFGAMTAYGGNSPSVSAAVGANQNGASASAFIAYYFEVLGAAGSVSLQYAASGSVGTGLGGFASASANYIIATTDKPYGIALVDLTAQPNVGQAQSSSPSFNVNKSLTIQTNTVYLESMAANVAANNSSATAQVDPTLSLTAAELAQGDQLVLSPNVANVPEPGTALMAALAGAMAWCGRRRVQA